MDLDTSDGGARTVVAPEQLDGLIDVIELVRTGEAHTKPELGRVSGLGRSVILQRIAQATAMGLVEEGDLGPSTGGRAPRRLRFRAEAGHFVSVAFGALHVGVAVYDLSGVLLAGDHGAWDISEGPEASLSHVDTMITKLLDVVPSAPLWAVAVGVPGPVEFATGRPIAPPIMPGWNDADIRGWARDRWGVPCWVDNDVNFMALGEWGRHGVPSDELLFVKVGSGIGAGLVSGGRVHRGANGAAGDIGHIAVHHGSSIVCRCGQTGCLEAVAGGWALARDAMESADAGASTFLAARRADSGRLTPADIAEGAVIGDAFCVRLVAESGRIVGETLASLVSFVNPGRLVVGGTVADAGSVFLAAVREAVYRRSLPLATRDLQIVQAQPGHVEGLDGGCQLLQAQIFGSRMSTWLPAGRPPAAGAAVYSG